MAVSLTHWHISRLAHSALQFSRKNIPLRSIFAGVAKLADALDLGSNAARHGGSSPSARTDMTETRA